VSIVSVIFMTRLSRQTICHISKRWDCCGVN